MKKRFFTAIPALCIALLFFAGCASAASNKTLPKDYDLQFQGAIDLADTKLEAVLLYEDGALKPDSRALPLIKRAPGKYIAPENTSTIGSHKGEIINWNDKSIAVFYFRPADIPKEKNGSIIVPMPFYPSGKKIKISDAKETFLFDIDVSIFSACNNDGICDDEGFESYATCQSDCEPCIENGVCVPEYGETTARCPKDCPAPPKKIAPQPKEPGAGNNSAGTAVPLTEKIYSWWVVAAIIAGLVGIGVTAYFMLRTKKTDQEDE